MSRTLEVEQSGYFISAHHDQPVMVFVGVCTHSVSGMHLALIVLQMAIKDLQRHKQSGASEIGNLSKRLMTGDCIRELHT